MGLIEHNNISEIHHNFLGRFTFISHLTSYHSQITSCSESREIVNTIGTKKIDDLQELWRELLALEEIANELEGSNHGHSL